MSSLELPENDPRPKLDYPLSETRLHRVGLWLAHRILRPFLLLEISGLEHLPLSGPAVVVANHVVNFDVFPLQLALPRMVFFMGKAELFQIPPVHWLFRQLGGFPVYRGERDAWALEHARRLLRNGQLVAIFPEGTRSFGKGLALAKPGAARLALEENCPVVVISIVGSQQILKKFPARVRIVLAPPVDPGSEESSLALTDKIMYTLAENLPLELRGVYAERPPSFR